MRREDVIRVAARPTRPLLVFDGDCGFCRQWVLRWRRMTGERVDYRPSQEVAGTYPEIGPERFRARVWLIEPDGRATGGAGAVFRLHALAGEDAGLAWLTDRSPLFAAMAEWVYGLVARRRGPAAALTGWLWGDLSQRPRHRRMRAIFLRALGAVYVAAFGSLAVQVEGLIGRDGILPVRDYLDAMGPAPAPGAFGMLPTLLWWDASDGFLRFLCWGGVAAGALLVAGVFPGPLAVVLWVFYLSITVGGQEFLSFQWDALLLETGLLAILFAPWRPWLGGVRHEPSRGVVWLLRWLVFRLMFLSGIVKLTSGDPAWAAWEAMKYHYETQPLPTWTSWYMHQLPPRFHTLSVGFMFWAELIAPFLIFGPRRLRMVGFWSFLALQVLILATGNYGFFNLLSIVLCLTLVEDRDWGRDPDDPVAPAPRRAWRTAVVGVAGPALFVATLIEATDRIGWAIPYPAPLESLREALEPLRSTNAYGLFAVMTTERAEILIEGSDDGETWRPYLFHWKPVEVDRRPRFATPHMPRLDWQLWFAALGRDCRAQPWFLRFEQRLLEGSPEVLRLLRANPFPDRPPRYIRARLFDYRFTRRGAKSKAWWTRTELGPYCPPFRL